MFTHILVPLDGSLLAESVLPAARYLAQQFHSKLTLLHVVEPAPPATVHGEPHLMDVNEAQEYLDSLARNREADNVTVEVHVEHAPQATVALSILEVAERLTADLIVLCAHGNGGLRDILFGSIAQQVLQAGEIPVLLLRAPAQAFELQKILVPLDGRSIYEPAIMTAKKIARATNSSLSLLLVVPTLGTLSPERAATGALLPSATQAVLELAERGAQEYVQKWVTQLQGEGIQTTSEIVRGETVPQIVQASQRLSADLLIMATHGRTGLGAFWSGSVAPNVLRQTKIPILLLRVSGEEPVR